MSKKYLIIALVVAFLSHLTFLNAGFVWLDQNDIVESRAVLPLREIGRAFFIPFGQTSFYRPVVTIVNSLDKAIYGVAPFGFHLTNIILHLLVIVSAFKFLPLFFNFSQFQLFLGSLILAVHPASILIIGEVIERQESLLLLFLMLTVILHSKARIKNSLKYELFAVLTFSLALFTKETALFVLPALIIFWEVNNSSLQTASWNEVKALTPGGWKKRLFSFEMISIILYLFLRLNAVPGFWGTEFPQLTLEENIASRLLLLGKFIIRIISPLKPSFSDSLKITGFNNLSVILTLLFVLTAIYIIFKNGLKSKTSKALLLFFILILPSLNLIAVPRISSPHYLYLPAVGFAALSVVIPSVVEGSFANARLFNKIFLLIIYLWLTVASVVTFKSGFRFKNDFTLFTPEVAKDPMFLEGYYYLGMYHLKNGDFTRAETEFQSALKKTPGYLVFDNRNTVLVNLSAIKFQKGDLEESENLLTQALNSNPQGLKPAILYNLALIARQKSDNQKVISLLKDIVFYRPEPYLLLAETYHQENMINEEIKTLHIALPFLNQSQKLQIENLIKNLSST